MSTVSVREFSYNPSAIFARVERGETIEVTRHGDVIAVLLPGSGTLGRYSSLAAKGLIRLKATTTSDLGRIPEYAVPAGSSPLDLLLAERAEDRR
jgi:antitoxin (DNA-binding transcriptional repressor) of toxin-antitoxin stability system